MRNLLFCLMFLGAVGLASATDSAWLGAPIAAPGATHMRVFPFVDAAPDVGPDYRLLDDALRKEALIVHETDAGGQVSELKVTYTGGRPIYAMAGEVLLGGKQDRIVAEPTIIPAGAEGFAVPVFCVEHGRWASKGTLKFKAGERLAHTSLRQMVHKQSQSAGWAEVAKTNQARGTANDSDTYRAAFQDEKRAARLEAVVTRLLAKTRAVDQMTGLLVAVNGEAVAFDRFASARLYRQLEPKLVRSYVAEALDVGRTGANQLDAAAAKAFMASARQGKTRVQRRAGNTLERLDNDVVEGSTVVDRVALRKRALHRNFYKRTANPAPAKQLRRMQTPRRIQRRATSPDDAVQRPTRRAVP